jgi:TolA-binding protein/thiol-disulfide isomerase/thioredoxin
MISRPALVLTTLAVAITSDAGTAFGGQGFDLDAWLGRPGVKLVALEFYATWCKPCMEAVPKWRALHERYRKDGLRLVVVATQDPKGGCSNPGWSPDDVLCDDDGRLAERFGAANLPAAFLWSWQGNLLANRAHVEEVEEKIRTWMREIPRVEVEVGDIAAGAGSGISKNGLRELVRHQLIDQDKLPVIATEQERRKLDEIKKRSFDAHYDDQLQCEVGKDLSANSLLQVFVTKSASRPRLQLSLLSAERGCLIASANVDWVPKKASVSIAEAVSELLQKLKTQAQLPWALASSKSAASASSPKEEEWTPEAASSVIVSFRSTPSGAVVLFDGSLLCQETANGCSRAVKKGAHLVAMEKEHYVKRAESVEMKEGLVIDWTLEENFGRLDVDSEPTGVEVNIDGQPAGKSPIQGHEVALGRHRVAVSDKCFLPTEAEVTVSRGQSANAKLSPKPREGAIDARAEDVKGNALGVEVYAGGKLLGKTPGVYKVPVCTSEIELRDEKLGTFVVPVKIEERTTVPVQGVLDPSVAATNDLAEIDSIESTARDGRISRARPRTTALLVTEIQGLENLFGATPEKAPDRLTLMRRLAEAYAELEMAAFRDKVAAELQRDNLKKTNPAAAGQQQATANARAATVTKARKQSIKYYDLLAKDPSYSAADEADYFLAYEYEQANDLANARKAYFDLIKRFPKSKNVPSAYFAFARLFEAEAKGDSSKWDPAMDAFRKVVTYPPPDNKLYGFAWYHLAVCAMSKNGDRSQQVDALKKAAEYGSTYAALPGAAKLKEIAEHQLAQTRVAARKK